jgi:protein-disulfide isomerase
MIVGAQRSKDRPTQRQSAGRAIAAARSANRDRNWIIITLVVIVVVAGVVIGGVVLAHSRSTSNAQTLIPEQTVSGSDSHPATIDRADATVLVGKPTAKLTIDAYEDFLCPICGEFESANAGVEQQLQAGTIQVHYHMINLLDSRSWSRIPRRTNW